MAQRQKIQNAKRQKRTRILSIFRHFALDRLEIRHQIAMRDHDAFGLGRGSRGEHDLGDVIALYGSLLDRRGLRSLLDLREPPYRDGTLGHGSDFVSDHNHPRLRLLFYTMKEVGRGLRVERHQHDSFEQAGPQRGNPTRTALQPQHGRLALVDSLGAETRPQGASGSRNIPIAIGPTAIAVVVDDKLGVDLLGALEKID